MPTEDAGGVLCTTSWTPLETVAWDTGVPPASNSSRSRLRTVPTSVPGTTSKLSAAETGTVRLSSPTGTAPPRRECPGAQCPEPSEANAGRGRRCERRARVARHDDLAAVCRRAYSRRRVHRHPDVVRLGARRVAAVDADAKPHLASVARRGRIPWPLSDPMRVRQPRHDVHAVMSVRRGTPESPTVPAPSPSPTAKPPRPLRFLRREVVCG